MVGKCIDDDDERVDKILRKYCSSCNGEFCTNCCVLNYIRDQESEK
jgi:hypothetical protein